MQLFALHLCTWRWRPGSTDKPTRCVSWTASSLNATAPEPLALLFGKLASGPLQASRERAPGFLPGRLKEREAQPPQRLCTRPLEGYGAARESRQGQQWKLIGQRAHTASRNGSSTPAEGRRMPPGAPMHRRTALLMCPRWRGVAATETSLTTGPKS